MPPIRLSALLEALPPHLMVRAWLCACMEGGEHPSDGILDRYCRTQIAAYLPRAVRKLSHHDLAAKRTVLHAMALLAATRAQQGASVVELAREWEYPREHLYRAAHALAADLGLHDWPALPSALGAFGVWPYDGHFVIEVIGGGLSLIQGWPIPLYRPDLPTSLTSYSLLPLINPATPVVQLVVDGKLTRKAGLALTSCVGPANRLHYRDRTGELLSPLEILQRLWHLRLRHHGDLLLDRQIHLRDAPRRRARRAG